MCVVFEEGAGGGEEEGDLRDWPISDSATSGGTEVMGGAPPSLLTEVELGAIGEPFTEECREGECVFEGTLSPVDDCGKPPSDDPGEAPVEDDEESPADLCP